MKQPLNFEWNYLPDFNENYLKELPSDKEVINIPHNIKDVPYNYFSENDYQKVVTYEKLFDVKEDIKDKRCILHFEGFMLQADIYLNDVNLGHFVSGYLPVKIDVTDSLKQKGNRLVVILDSREDPKVPPFGYAVDYLTFSGIYREVSLEIHPKSYLENIYVHGDMNGNIEVQYDVVGDNVEPSFQLYDGEKLLIESEIHNFSISNPTLWDINNPYLYTMKVIIPGETYEIRFGFKTQEFKEDGFYLNGKKLKLVGLNRHQAYAYVGYAMPKSMQIDDAKKLKGLGLNLVRTSHYPQSEHFLNALDELGLLYVNEIPGWQHISKDEEWRNHYYDFVKRMVLKERGHTSLIAHGVRIDESQDDHELYLKGNEIAHTLDKYHQTLGVRNFKKSELLEDIYGYNDFSCADLSHGVDNPKSVKRNHKPYLITEYMGHMQPHKPTSDISMLQHVALRHLRVLNDARKYEQISGTIGWCFVDYYTHVDFGSGDHLCNHGVLDLYRNPKYAAFSYMSQQDDKPVLEVLTNMRPGDFKEASYQDIFVLTNADRIDLYKNDEFAASFYPDKKHYKYLKHPPIQVLDVLGETFKDERFSKKEALKLAKIFSYGGIYGFNHLKPTQALYVALMYIKHHLSWADLVDLWNTHISTWGGYAKTFTFKAIKDGEIVSIKTIRPSHKFHINYEYDRNVLKNEETYDVLPIRVSFVDEDDNVMKYANKAIDIKVEGQAELIGPSMQTLLGGQITLYIKSKKDPGNAKVIIASELETKEIELEVK